MHKSDNTILIWVLSWAGVLLALLYSPFGSPELYHTKRYFTDNQGVNFNKITIKNEPKRGSEDNYTDAELGVDIRKSSHTRNYNYSVNASGKSGIKNITSYNIRKTSSRSTRQSSNASGSSSSAKGNRGGTGGNSRGGGILSISKTAINGSGNLGGGLAVTKVDLSLFSDSTALASEYSRQKTDYIDPGNEDPTADPIPVGDGWLILLFLVIMYAVRKYYIHLKTQTILN